MRDLMEKRISATSITTLMKIAVLGFLSSEIWFFSLKIADKISKYIISKNFEFGAIIIGMFGFLLLVFYVLLRNIHFDIKKIFQSCRFDIFIIFGLGIFFSSYFGGVWSDNYEKLVSSLKIDQLIILVTFPFILGILLILRTIQIKIERRNSNISSFFLIDKEQEDVDNDLLGFAEESERFAERIYNNGSIESMVFGIDAPWGIGKSSFINFCEKHWEKNYKEKVIVYNFNPLRYENRNNLLEKFVDGLIRQIQKNVFVPEIRPLISKYSRFIKGSKGKFSFFGIDFELLSGSYTIDDAFEDLESAIINIDKKIIIIVDDLDRLSFSAIKDVLFVIKKSFTLPNISYVICYDTDNIHQLEKETPGIEKVTEFLEKFVNIKISLYPENQKLQDYVTKNIEQALVGNFKSDPVLISSAIGGLIDIYKSKDYHKYLAFVGDVRKLKRLINTLLLFEIEKTDFDNSDFNKEDLVHLLLVYINYPNVFRKIYETETNQKRGFFSLLSPLDDNYPRVSGSSDDDKEYKNSPEYDSYLKTLSENQQFLLNKIFKANERFKSSKMNEVTENERSSFACFNGSWVGAPQGRNLEQYLNLIVKLSKPPKYSQLQYYTNIKNKILSGSETIQNTFSAKDFSFENEEIFEETWRVITNSVFEFDTKTGAEIIKYLLEELSNYPLFLDKKFDLRLRKDLTLYLAKLLDQVGWSDKNGKHRDNTEEYISEIAEWIFGEKRHNEHGILEILSKEDRGILGLYDLLAFRLYCSADRGGHFFNLQRALSFHGDPNAPTTGAVVNIVKEEMREISQLVFSIFKTQYIDKNKNIFEIIDSLSIEDLAGKFKPAIDKYVLSGEISNIQEDLEINKSIIKSFIIYQLGNSIISSGVGCGLYDESGKEDKNGIREKFNDYLFNQCFSPQIATGFENFLRYLLMNLSSTFEEDDRWVPNANELTKVLIKERVAEYWNNNKATIEALNLQQKDTIIITSAYTVNYKEYLPRIFKLLDEISVEVAASQAEKDEQNKLEQNNQEPKQKTVGNTTSKTQ